VVHAVGFPPAILLVEHQVLGVVLVVERRWQTGLQLQPWGGGNLIYVDGHVKFKANQALHSGDFGLNPPDDAQGPVLGGGVCDKIYSAQF
jgi:prepilin-type processing-associated H-X9-DG protein